MHRIACGAQGAQGALRQNKVRRISGDMEGVKGTAMSEGKRVLVAMSGGVDSSVSAKILIDQGFECVGCTMRLHEATQVPSAAEDSCGSGSDIDDARQVAQRLGIPHHTLEYMSDFKKNVIDPFCASYLSGCTPNPCVDCNRTMKFGKLFDFARSQACEYVATGHYVRVEQREDGFFYLRKAADTSKDQSYVLYALSQDQLSRVIFPLGGMSKTLTRGIAAGQGFGNAEKAESMDICFVPDGDYARVVEKYAGSLGEPGDFVTSAGEIRGQHQGIARYTIGQRKGLGLYGPEPLYVNAIDPHTNTITVGPRHELMQRDCLVGEVCWAAGAAPAEEFRCAAKIRYRQIEQPCTVHVESDSRVRVVFDEPQSAITPGQAAVFYDGEYVLGGGRIKRQ